MLRIYFLGSQKIDYYKLNIDFQQIKKNKGLINVFLIIFIKTVKILSLKIFLKAKLGIKYLTIFYLFL